MAQTLNITIKINQQGLGNIDQIIKKVKELNSSMQSNSLVPFKQSTDVVNESLKKMVGSLSEIEKRVSVTIATVRGQTKDIADNTAVRAIEKANKGFETMLGRAGLFVAGTGLVSSNIDKIVLGSQSMASLTSLIGKDVGVMSNLVASVLDKNFATMKGNIFLMQRSFEFFRAGIIDVVPLAQGLAGAFLQIGGGIVTFTAMRFLIGEVGVLLRRVVGRGTESLTILERATRLMTTFDDGLNRSFNTIGKYLKVGGFGLLTFFSPLFGAVPLINSITDVLLIRARGVKDRIARFFGDGRASITLIFQDARKLLTDILPGFLRIGERFSSILKKLKKDDLDAILLKIFGIQDQSSSFLSKIGVYFKTIFSPADSSFRKSVTLFPEAKKAEELQKSMAQVNATLDKVTSNTKLMADNFEKAAIASKKISVPVPVLPSGKELNSAFPKLTSLSFASTEKKEAEAIKETAKSVVVLGEKFTEASEKVVKSAKKINDAISSFVIKAKIQPKSEILSKDSLREKIEKAMPIFQAEQSRLSEIFYKQKRETISPIGGNRFNFEDMFLSLLKEGKTRKKIDSVMIGTGFLGQYKDAFDKIQKNQMDNFLSKAIGKAPQKNGIIDQVFSLQNISGLEGKLQRLNSSAQAFSGLRKEIFDSVKNILDFEKASRSLDKTLKGIRTPLTVFGNLVEQFASGKNVKADTFSKSFEKVNQSFFKFSDKFGTGSLFDIGKIKVAISKGFSPDKESVSLAFADLKKEIDKLTSEGTIKGKTFGKKLTSLIAEGINGNTQVSQAITKLAELIAAFFPQSPAKQGPLKALPKMGRGIVQQIADGMQSGIGLISKAAGSISERIAGFFPRSPALYGALVFLLPMGRKIVSYLAMGIETGFAIINGVMTTLTNLIAAPLEKIRNLARLDFLSQRTGASTETISALGAAIEQVGGNASELDYTLVRIRETIGKRMTGDESAQFFRAGIDLKKIKESGDPALETFEQLSDIVQKFGLSSMEAKQAMDLFSITSNSAMVNLFTNGRQGLRGTIAEISRFGGVVSSETAKNSRDISVIETKLKQFKDFLYNEFIAGILPTIKQAAGTIFEFFQANALKIRAFVQTVASVLGALANLIGRFAMVAIENPTIAIDSLLKTVKIFFSLVAESSQIFFDGTKNSLMKFFVVAADVVGVFVDEFIVEVGKKILLHLDVIYADTKVSFYNFLPQLLSFLQELPGKILGFLAYLFNQVSGFVRESLSMSKFGQTILKAVEKITLAVINFVYKFIKGTYLEDFLRFLGLGDVLNSAEEFSQNYKAILEEIDKKNEESISIAKERNEELAKQSRELLRLQGTSPDANADRARENLANSRSLGDITKQAFDKVMPKIKELKQASTEFVNDINSPDLWEKFKSASTESLEQVKQTFTDIGLKEEIEQLLNALSPDQFKQKLQQLEFTLKEKQNNSASEAGSPTLQKESGFSFGFENLLNNVPTKLLSEDMEKLMTLGKTSQQVFGDFGNTLQQVFEKGGKKAKEFARIAKGVSLASAIINVAVGVTEALKLPFPLSLIQAATVAAMGGIQVATIMGQGFKSGGYIKDGTTQTADDVPIRVSRNEYVLRAAAVQKYGLPFIESLNKMQFPLVGGRSNIPATSYMPPRSSYATGGLVESGKSGKSGEQIINVISTIDPVDVVSKAASSLQGQKIFMNMLANNGPALKKIVANS